MAEIIYKNRKEEISGFEILVTTQNTFSCFRKKSNKLVYIVDKEALEVLKENGVKFKIL